MTGGAGYEFLTQGDCRENDGRAQHMFGTPWRVVQHAGIIGRREPVQKAMPTKKINIKMFIMLFLEFVFVFRAFFGVLQNYSYHRLRPAQGGV